MISHSFAVWHDKGNIVVMELGPLNLHMGNEARRGEDLQINFDDMGMPNVRLHLHTRPLSLP